MSTPTLQPHIRRLGALLAALAVFLFPFFPESTLKAPLSSKASALPQFPEKRIYSRKQ